MEVKINANLQSTVERLARERNVTPEAYVTNFVERHLVSQYKQDLMSKISLRKIDDLVTIESAILPVCEAIRIRDYVAPNPILGEILDGK